MWMERHGVTVQGDPQHANTRSWKQPDRAAPGTSDWWPQVAEGHWPKCHGGPRFLPVSAATAY
jgi:hypothetical protein